MQIQHLDEMIPTGITQITAQQQTLLFVSRQLMHLTILIGLQAILDPPQQGIGIDQIRDHILGQ